MESWPGGGVGVCSGGGWLERIEAVPRMHFTNDVIVKPDDESYVVASITISLTMSLFFRVNKMAHRLICLTIVAGNVPRRQCLAAHLQLS